MTTDKIQRAADEAKIEIVTDMRRGIVPTGVRTFSELHDYVDANMYGPTDTLSIEEVDEMQTIVDAWLRSVP